jgi:hypothetical protein
MAIPSNAPIILCVDDDSIGLRFRQPILVKLASRFFSIRHPAHMAISRASHLRRKLSVTVGTSLCEVLEAR